MGLRFDPVGGGQFKQALKQLIEVERQPVKNLEVRKQREEARLKLFQDFKTKFTGFDKTLGEFTDFRKFRELKADLGDGQNFMSVTLDKDRAEAGSYTIQIDQLASRTSVITNGFEDPDTAVLGIGFVVGQLANGETTEIFVDEANSSLRGVETLINRQPGNPVRASVIKDLTDPERPWRLILTAKKDGADDAVYFPEFYFLDGNEDLYIDNENDAQNALLMLDGFPIESDGNQIKEFLKGVNVQLKGARPDQPFTLTITEDHQKIAGKVKLLIDQINSILDFINKQNQVDDKSDTRTTFTGDTSLQSIEYRLRNLVHEGFPVGDPDSDDFKFTFLTELGVEFDKGGQLTFKEDKFTKALEGDFEAIAEVVTGPWGFANQLKTVIQGYTQSGTGLLQTREQGLRQRIKKIDDDITQKERRIDQRTEALTGQFARLQASLSSLQRQQQYLQATLPSGGGGNLVSQLLGGG